MDLAFFWNVGHDIGDWGAYSRWLGRVLRTGGRVAVIDFRCFPVFES